MESIARQGQAVCAGTVASRRRETFVVIKNCRFCPSASSQLLAATDSADAALDSVTNIESLMPTL